MSDYSDPLLDPRLRPYLKDVQAWHGYVRFLGLPTLQDHPDTPLSELFVPPLLSKYSVSSDSPMENWPQGQPVLATLHEAKRLVVLGDPGSGKSVLINWLAWLLVSGVEERIPEWLRGCIPLPLVLREMELGGVETFDGLLEALLKRPVALNLRGQKDLLRKMLAAGKVLVLVDGLDEVSSGQREPLRDALWDGLFDHYPESFFLATSRLVGYDECPVDNYSLLGQLSDLESKHLKTESILPLLDDLETATNNWDKELKAKGVADNKIVEKLLSVTTMINKDSVKKIAGAIITLKEKIEFIQRLYVMPFDDERIRAFSVNWYRLRSLKPSADSDAEQFIKALFRDDTTRRLARNPQLLTLMALVFRVRAHLPDGRALLYDLIAEAYLESIDKARNISTSAADAAPWREKRRWLARVGFEMQYRRTAVGAGHTRDESPSDPSNRGHGPLLQRAEGEKELLATRTEVRDWLSAAMRDSGYSANPGFVDSYLDWVARRSGLLLPRGEDQFAFVHLSFQEYFASLYLCEHFVDADWVLAQRDGSAVEGDQRISAASLREWAKDPRWQETLVFCFENFAIQPKDAKRLLCWVFGKDYEDFLANLKPSDEQYGQPPESERADLLARIITNPHSGLNPAERGQGFENLWKYFDQAERRFDREFRRRNPKPISRLLVSQEWGERFWKKIHQLQPKALNLEDIENNNLSALAELTCLIWLNLIDTTISEIAPLSDLTGLRELCLSGTSITNLAPVANFKSLEWLEFRRTPINDLSPLSTLKSLKRLYLEATAVTDLTPLSELTKLQHLDLGGTKINDLSPLARMKNLVRLDLFGTAVIDLKPLMELSSLQILDLSGTAVIDISPLVEIQSLKSLRLYGIKANVPDALKLRDDLEIIGP